MDSSEKSTTRFTQEHLAIIFSNIDELAVVHRTFLSTLEELLLDQVHDEQLRLGPFFQEQVRPTYPPILFMRKGCLHLYFLECFILLG